MKKSKRKGCKEMLKTCARYEAEPSLQLSLPLDKSDDHTICVIICCVQVCVCGSQARCRFAHGHGRARGEHGIGSMRACFPDAAVLEGLPCSAQAATPVGRPAYEDNALMLCVTSQWVCGLKCTRGCPGFASATNSASTTMPYVPVISGTKATFANFCGISASYTLRARVRTVVQCDLN